jgi:hypothetical protein
MVPPPEPQRAPYGSDVPRTRTSFGRVDARWARGPSQVVVRHVLLGRAVLPVEVLVLVDLPVLPLQPLKEGEVTTTVPNGNADDAEAIAMVDEMYLSS